MAKFQVFAQLAPVKDRKSDTWFPVLYPVGEVIAEDDHHGLFAAKAKYNLFAPILKQITH